MKIINLGCGSRAPNHPDIINIDWSIYLRLRRSRVLSAIAPLVLDKTRLERFRNIPTNVLVHDLSKGIPFEDNSVDVVYHCHFMEHLDRDVAEALLRESLRVLKPGGIHRIVVPDFEYGCRLYIEHLTACQNDPSEIEAHDEYISGILSWSVKREASGTSLQKPMRRFIENLVLGDARKRGDTHQWMYDRFNIKAKLLAAGYSDVHIQDFQNSAIPNWGNYSLDANNGIEHKPNSLYAEGIK